LLLAVPVVGLGEGSGIVLPHGLVVTTHDVAFRTARPEVKLEDGGTLPIAGTLIDDAERGLALLVIDGELPRAAVLSRAAPDGGALSVVTLTGAYPAQATPALDVTVTDAGELSGAPLVGEGGEVYGMMRDAR